MYYSKVAKALRKIADKAKARRVPTGSRPYPRTTLGLMYLEDRTVPANLLGLTANGFAVLGGMTVTNTGPSVITGDVGVGPGTAIPGFPPGLVLAPGVIHSADAVALQAQSEVTTAYNNLALLAPTATLTGQNLGGLTLTPGVYFFANTAQLTGTLTLDGQGDPNAVFVFQIGSTLTTATASSVVFINGATAQETYWQVGSSATLGTATRFAGNILALTSITLDTGATISCGRALARNGAVTLDSNVIVNDCANTPGSISGRKIEDLNGDGILQPGEPGLAGATVYLDLNGNRNLDAGEQFAVSNANGDYTIINVPPGTYTVLEVQRADLVQTTADPLPVTVAAGQAVVGINFGDFRRVTITGVTFNDVNGNGIRDAGDAGVPGVTVFLDTNNNGNLDGGESSTTTGPTGTYTFTNVGPGTTRVREVLPPGTVRTTTLPADITPVSGVNIDIAPSGNFTLVSIGGIKFNDLNGNGIRDVGDAGVAGVTVFLDTNNNGNLDAGEVRTTTGVTGTFTFANVGPGATRVREVQPTGTVRTTPNPADITPFSGVNVDSAPLGNFTLVSISGVKFNDLNGNGIRSGNEVGMAGVTIFLDTNNNGILDLGESRTTTDLAGNYRFANVGPGNFRVREVNQTGWIRMTNNPAVIATVSGANATAAAIGNTAVANLFGASKLMLTGRNMAPNVLAEQAQFVANLYETRFGRAPDLSSLNYYVRMLQAGYTTQYVAARFLWEVRA